MLTQHVISLQEHRQWFERASQDSAKCLLIFEEAGRSAGFVHFSGVSPGGIAHWGFHAAPDAPKGTGTKLGRAALGHAFGPLALHKVCGEALAFNEASIHFHLKLGFRQEGVLRDQQRIGPVYHDLICFGLLDYEWSKADRGIL